jgi:hypothetical protein
MTIEEFVQDCHSERSEESSSAYLVGAEDSSLTLRMTNYKTQ